MASVVSMIRADNGPPVVFSSRAWTRRSTYSAASLTNCLFAKYDDTGSTRSAADTTSAPPARAQRSRRSRLSTRALRTATSLSGKITFWNTSRTK